MTGAESVLSVLRTAIAALARADAPQLERLAAEAGQAILPAEERNAAREQYAALGLLLGLTRRNLRLLRGERVALYGRN